MSSKVIEGKKVVAAQSAAGEYSKACTKSHQKLSNQVAAKSATRDRLEDRRIVA